ncbi:MAG: glycosyltransferase [Chitinophagales bacterium]|nr:glycosyltransferase [Chitinophagales bacterium]
MRILHFIDSLDFGGAETLLMSLVSLLPEHDHIIVTMHGPNVYPVTNYEYIELDFHTYHNLFRARKVLGKIIRQKKVDIVHSHSYWTNIISRLATPKSIKLFNHYHFADYDTLRKRKSVRMMMFIDRMIRHRNLIRIAVSEYVYGILIKLFNKEKVKVLPNFISCGDLHEFKNISDRNDLRIVAVGNCNIEKNYDYLIQTFVLLKDEPFRIDIMGGGPLLDYYRKKVQELGLSKVNFCGNKNQIRQRLPEYDLFISTSFSESFGIAVLEALCAGLPVMLSDIPAFKEIAPSVTCFFDLSDKNDLAKKIITFSKSFPKNNTDEYNKILQRYSPQNFLYKLSALYLN